MYWLLFAKTFSDKTPGKEKARKTKSHQIAPVAYLKK
jgi:hypothetical protein